MLHTQASRVYGIQGTHRAGFLRNEGHSSLTSPPTYNRSFQRVLLLCSPNLSMESQQLWPSLCHLPDTPKEDVAPGQQRTAPGVHGLVRCSVSTSSLAGMLQRDRPHESRLIPPVPVSAGADTGRKRCLVLSLELPVAAASQHSCWNVR